MSRGQWLGIAVTAMVLGYTTAFTATTTHRLTYDTRNESGEWIERHVPPGSVLLLAHSILRSYSPLPDPERVPSRLVRLGRLDRTVEDLLEADRLARGFAREVVRSLAAGN